MLIPLPSETPGLDAFLSPVSICLTNQLLNPCLDNKMYINASLVRIGQISSQEQKTILDLIKGCPDFVNSSILVDSMESLINESPDFALEVLRTLRRQKKDYFDK